VRYQLTDIYRPDSTGFDAIAVSLLGQNSGIGVVLSGILFAGLDVGRNVMQSGANVSKNLADILQALILFSIAANFLRSLRLRLPSLRNVRGAESQVEPGVAAVVTDTAPGATVDAGASGGSPGE
jgi:simple sugar transport system permease protein